MAVDSTAATKSLSPQACEKCGQSDGEEIVPIYPGHYGGYVRYMHKKCYKREEWQIFLFVGLLFGALVFYRYFIWSN
jgi:hypothetical protein